MKILFLGLGSIGQRHLINVKKTFKNADIFAFRTASHQNIIKDTKLVKKTSLGDYYNIKNLNNYNAALRLKPDLTFICNPSSKHLGDAYNFAKIKSHLFIEKPLGDSPKLYRKLIHRVKKNKLITMIGYQTRFNPIIKYIENVIKKNRDGKIIYAEFKNLSYLPKYHIYENYKKSYASNKNLGGGVLSSQIHEVDLISHFFGLPTKTYNTRYNSGSIGIKADDNFSSIMLYKRKNYLFNLSLRLSFTQFYSERGFTICFEKKIYKVDLIKNELKIISRKNKKIIKKTFKINRNDLFLREIQLLKKSIKYKKNNFLSILTNQNTQKLYFKLKK